MARRVVETGSKGWGRCGCIPQTQAWVLWKGMELKDASPPVRAGQEFELRLTDLGALAVPRPQLAEEQFPLGTSTNKTAEVRRAGRVGGALCDSAEVPGHLPSWASSRPLPTATGVHLSGGGQGWSWGDQQVPLLLSLQHRALSRRCQWPGAPF